MFVYYLFRGHIMCVMKRIIFMLRTRNEGF